MEQETVYLKTLSETVEVRFENEQLILVNADGKDILAKLMHSDAISIRAFHPVQATLEDIFLKATRRSWELPPEGVPDPIYQKGSEE